MLAESNKKLRSYYLDFQIGYVNLSAKLSIGYALQYRYSHSVLRLRIILYHFVGSSNTVWVGYHITTHNTLLSILIILYNFFILITYFYVSMHLYSDESFKKTQHCRYLYMFFPPRRCL